MKAAIGSRFSLCPTDWWPHTCGLVTNQMLVTHTKTKSCRLFSLFLTPPPCLCSSPSFSPLPNMHFLFILLDNSTTLSTLSVCLFSFTPSLHPLQRICFLLWTFVPLRILLPSSAVSFTLDLFLSFISFSVPSHHYTPSWMSFILHPFIPLSFAITLFRPSYDHLFFFICPTDSFSTGPFSPKLLTRRKQIRTATHWHTQAHTHTEML